jgi:hypothetical protein
MVEFNDALESYFVVLWYGIGALEDEWRVVGLLLWSLRACGYITAAARAVEGSGGISSGRGWW